MIMAKTFYAINALYLLDYVERFFGLFPPNLIQGTRMGETEFELEFQFPHPNGGVTPFFSSIHCDLFGGDIRLTVASNFSYVVTTSPPGSYTVSGGRSSSSLLSPNFRNCVCSMVLDEDEYNGKFFAITLRAEGEEPVVIAFMETRYDILSPPTPSYFGRPYVLFSTGNDFNGEQNPETTQPSLASFVGSSSGSVETVAVGRVFTFDGTILNFTPNGPLWLPMTCILDTTAGSPGQTVTVNNGVDTGVYLAFLSLKDSPPPYTVSYNIYSKVLNETGGAGLMLMRIG